MMSNLCKSTRLVGNPNLMFANGKQEEHGRNGDADNHGLLVRLLAVNGFGRT